jgi:DNA-binding SARP family transcriptional activator
MTDAVGRALAWLRFGLRLALLRMLRISLLGVLGLEVDGVQIPPPSSRRARLLLGMLAVERRSHSREALSAWLWPEVLDESARASLRTALTQMRAALGQDAGRFLHTTREHVALAGLEEVWTDVGELEQLLAQGHVYDALALWRGELLTGLEDDWVYERRDEMRQCLCDALRVAAGAAEADDDLDAALLLTRRRVALDPLAEEPHRELIRHLACIGDRPAALAAYEKLGRRLREQLGTVPSAATRQLVAMIRADATSGEYTDGTDRRLAVGEAARRTAALRGALPRPLQPSATPFVGRNAELARLRQCWMQVCAGARIAMVISGEPGIGKTRLAAELARAVYKQDALVLYGRCDEGLAVPYQPFVEALRPYSDTIGPDRLGAELGHMAPELGRLLPALAELGEPARADPESERFALFEAVAALMEAMTVERPALLVLDDLHWAAKPTLLLLRHLLRCERPLRALVLCTYRETELDLRQPLAELLADLQRDDSAARLSIGGLDERAIAALVEAALGHALDERASQLVPLLRTQTAGNPFFIRELLAHVTESHTILSVSESMSSGVTAAQLDAPEGLRHVIGHRVARLSAAAQRVLSVAAVAGPRSSFALLEEVLGERSRVLDALDESVAARLLSEAGHGDYVFAHALVRQTIYEQLSAARRMDLHRQLGEAIEALGGTDMHVELAHHFAQAAADGHGLKAAAYALAAGRSAAVRLGYEEAAVHYERGLEALTLTRQPQEQRRCELLLALGEARWGAGDLDNARHAYHQAAELADQLGDPTALARAALGFRGPQRFEAAAAITRPVATLLRRALSALGNEDSPLRAQLMGHLAAALAYTDVEQRDPVLARQALDMARRVADKATLADVLASTHRTTSGPKTLSESVALAAELRYLADEIGDHRLQALAHRWLYDHLLELGDIEAVERELEALRQLAETRGERYFKWLLGVFRASRAHLQGQLEHCETLARDAFDHRFQGHDEPAALAFSMQIVGVRCEQGRLAEFVESVQRSAHQYPQVASWRCTLAYINAQLERRTAAHHELEALAQGDFRDLPRDTFWLSNLSALGEVVVFLDDAPRAQLLYELLLPYADRCVVTFVGLCQGSVYRPLGLLTTTLSRYDDAERHFQQAIKINTQIRSPLWIAHSEHAYAQMLLRRNRPGDHNRARTLVNRALSTAEDLGLKALADKARQLKLAAQRAASPQ